MSMRNMIMVAMSLTLLFTCLLPAPALAVGVALGPATMEIKDALRGEEYITVVTAFNPSAYETDYIVRADGQSADWLSFFDWNTKEPVQRLSIAGGSNTPILVNVNIPPDITNGTYTTTIYVETASSVNITEGVSTTMQASSVLTIEVTGTQILDGTVGSIQVHETEAGMPLILQVFFKNTGNVAVQPDIDCQISKDNNSVAEFSYADKSVKPGSGETIQVDKWSVPTDLLGDYVAKVTVSLAEKILATQDISFTIVPPGTFTMQGELTSLSYEGETAFESMLKILADFKNTGEGDARGKLMAEIYHNGILTDTIQSEDTLVPVRQTRTLTTYLKLENNGKYTIKGYVHYEGKTTDIREVSFEVIQAHTEESVAEVTPAAAEVMQTPESVNSEANPGEDGDDNETSTWYLWTAIAVIAVVVLVAGNAFMIMKKRSQSKV